MATPDEADTAGTPALPATENIGIPAQPATSASPDSEETAAARAVTDVASQNSDTSAASASGDAAQAPAVTEADAPQPVAPEPVAPVATSHLVDANSANDTIELELIKGFAQEVNWGVPGATTMVIDEPEPLGENRGPSPGRVLAAALASCLGASLLFCLKKSRIDVQGLHTIASVALTRNDKGRLRIGTITVRLAPVVPLDQQPRMARCLEVFEDFCIVTASVRPAVTVNVSVEPVAPA